MNKKKVFIKCKASEKDGWGNLQRQFNIAELIDKRKYIIIFFFQGSTKGYEFLKKKYLTINFDKKINLTLEKKLIEKYGIADIFIIEQLKISLKAQKIYSSVSKKLIIFDDLLENNYRCTYLFCCQKNDNYYKIKNNTYNSYLKFFYGYKSS